MLREARYSSNTDIRPTVKTAYTITFRFWLICRFQIPLIGISRIATSDMMLKRPLLPSRAGKLTQCPGTRLSHIRARGMH